MSELRLLELITSILDSNLNIPRDLRVDDRDLPEYPNFFQFVTDRNGANVEPFSLQLTVATHVFAEYCPNCSHPRFNTPHLVPKSTKAAKFPNYVTFLEYGVCPKCKATKRDLIKSGKLRWIEEMDACLGQRSGKSSLVALMAAYVLHKYLKLQRPTEVFGLLRNSILVGTFVGLSFSKAVELLWNPFLNIITNSNWFNEYHKLLNYYSEKYGEELYKVKDQIIHYKHRSLLLYPSGPMKRTLRGATRFLSCIDELGWFHYGEEGETKERASAEEVYASLDRSLKTIRAQAKRLLNQGYNNIPTAYAFNVSSPSSKNDKIMQLVRVHQNSPDVFVIHMPTWEFNPNFTKKDFAKEFRDNPIKAERDFGANPPITDNPYISNPYLLSKLFVKGRNRITYEYKFQTIGHFRYRYAVLRHVKPVSEPSIMGIDGGYSLNSFAISVGRKVNERIIIDGLVEVTPQKNVDVINFSRVLEEIIIPLVDQLNVELVLIDRWQSLKILSDLHDQDIEANQYSLKYEDFSLIRSYLLEENPSVFFPKLSDDYQNILGNIDNYPHCFFKQPVDHLFFQFSTVRDTGRSVEKGIGYTDDLFRSTCLVLYGLLNNLISVESKPVKRTIGVNEGNTSMIPLVGVVVSRYGKIR